MFKRTAVVALGLALAFTALPVPASEPANLQPHKRELREYIDSGEYAQSVAAVALSANKYLVRRVARGAARHENMAIVFDIDETALSNLGQILANDYGYIPALWDRWVAQGQATAIIPVQIVYDSAVKAKIAVFFITGRHESDRAATERNLRQVGYDTWTKIYFKPATDVTLTTTAFKIDMRRKITKDGYVIIANLGDQDGDLVGGYAERTFKLPNPFYLTK